MEKQKELKFSGYREYWHIDQNSRLQCRIKQDNDHYHDVKPIAFCAEKEKLEKLLREKWNE